MLIRPSRNGEPGAAARLLDVVGLVARPHERRARPGRRGRSRRAASPSRTRVALEASSALNPTIAATTCSAIPHVSPRTTAQPAARPPPSTRLVSSAWLGPGVRISSTERPRKVSTSQRRLRQRPLGVRGLRMTARAPRQRPGHGFDAGRSLRRGAINRSRSRTSRTRSGSRSPTPLASVRPLTMRWTCEITAKPARRDHLAGLDHVPDGDLGALSVPVADVQALLERPDVDQRRAGPRGRRRH